MNFLEWNDALASHFFHPEMAGRGVFLYVSDDVLADLAGRPDGKTSFIEVVKGGAPGPLVQAFVTELSRLTVTGEIED